MKPGRWSRRVCTGGMLIVAVWAAALSSGCGASSEPDPRCSIDAEPQHLPAMARFVNRSKLWQAYFKQLDPSGAAAQTFVAFRLAMERETFRASGGDYDPGRVTIRLTATHLSSGATLFEREEEVNLKDFIIGSFDKNTPREEIQQAAFEATEKAIYPFLERWVNLTAIRAMAKEGDGAFIPVLEALMQDQWSQLDERAEARKAIDSLR